jgi:CheY-like chemotaxis protein
MNCPERDSPLPYLGLSRNKGEYFVKRIPEDDGLLQAENSKLPGEGPAPAPMRDSASGGRQGAVRVVVADDHEALRQCLCRLLRDTGDLEVVGQAANGQEAIALTRELLPDLVLMDVKMPHIDGIEATRRIVRDYPAVRVLAISADWHKTTVTNMLAAGASGCVSKSVPSSVLLEAIRTVSLGRHYLCAEVRALFKSADPAA